MAARAVVALPCAHALVRTRPLRRMAVTIRISEEETVSLERFRLRRSTIAAVAGVCRAFVGREELKRDDDEVTDLLEVARARVA